MRVGLFFGSFNPIHIGHLVIADVMADQTDLEQVWFVVSPLNPFKSSSSLLHEFDRLKMVELAIEDNFKFRASDVEFNMPRPSYTADTLAYLSDKYPQNEFKLIIGEDNLVHFHKWKNYESVLENFGLYVYPRPQVDKSKIKIKHENIKYIDSPMLDISATFIRSSIRNDHSVQYLLPSPVIDYIRFKKFYQ
ncbi:MULTISPECIES: nicotinate (nicotinamide) nucleotide adenylyltransferase [Roseivirga]|uniref:Probable nicotinate-nucleotide adenylyltransferase n=1 Tax=Roseivirga spongicola TaxID=333140 RepID=A0A150X977_9BACT|nr:MULTISPECIES: nicotinate (nicotinamide) nucleotide adenylyltransferase [Roseivirga]PWL27510.1 MAG: nicotinate-nucleotide adenylyltransferase [Roseivirga sp. XM-24bin3]KYG75234.1 nicotinate-nicotinamide nucleotide adenylyltransferase [Roseivirga spongicola]MBO6494855.1 nicotinate-nucleotide adenylyltransferase [Roseivirga sp.]MBO6661977.1 nicotinate-nucleotide adenylyltransferase [Roseivirga sp.]MBO6909434.1 nicotinate-nucleotide adenylyltransferase [Roseivirga sp.]